MWPRPTPDLECRLTGGNMPYAPSLWVLVATLASFTFQGQAGSSQRSLPSNRHRRAVYRGAGRAERQFCEAIRNKDARTLDSLVSENFALRVADVPQSSLPRTVWMDNTLNRITNEHCEQHHVVSAQACRRSRLSAWSGARKGRPMDGTSAATFIWSIFGRRARGIGRLSPVLHSARQVSRAAGAPTAARWRRRPGLTEHLRQLEQQFGKPAGTEKFAGRLIGADFTLRVEMLPNAASRALREDPQPRATRAYKIESLEERHHAARKLTNDLAVVSLLLTQKATFAGRDRSGDFYVVDIWRKTAGNWQIIARYSTPSGRNSIAHHSGHPGAGGDFTI